MLSNKKSLTKVILMGLLASSNVIWGGTEVHAEEPQQFLLDEYVVTATRTPVKEFEAQANISVITRKELEERNYKDLYTALRDVPGVQTYSYGQAGYLTSNALQINGSNKVVVLIDGIRANQGAEIFSPGTITDLGDIERIEILKGAASALYGADAQGGVINIITKKAGGKSKIFVNGGNFGRKEYGGIFNVKKDKLGIRVSAKKYEDGDFKSAKGERIFSNQESNTYNVALSYELKENSSINFNYDLFNNRFAYLTPGKNTGGYGKFDSTNVRLVWNQEFDENTHNVFSIGHNRRAYAPSWGESAYRSLLVQEQFSKNLGDRHLVTAGVDYEGSDVLNQPSYNSKYIGENINTTAYYLQDQWSITKKLNLIAGVRYTSPNAFESVWTPNLNLGYTFSDKTNMYVSWNKFFDTPSISQMYDDKHGNASLKPEDGKNFELGINHKITDDFLMSMHYFYRNTTNAIMYDRVTELYYNSKEEVRTKGFDVQLKKAFGEHVNTYVGYTYLQRPATGSVTTQQANYGGYLPRSAWNIGADYSNDKFDAGIVGRGIIKRPGYYSTAGKSFPNDSYWVWDLNCSYKIKKNVRAYVNINNIFNQYYAENSDVYWQNEGGYPSLGGDYKWWPMPGRSFIVGMEYTF